MDYFEKFVFLELTWKQFARLDRSEYYSTISSLSEEEDELSIKISREIHNIYNVINSKVEGGKNVNSIIEYHQEVSSVSDVILKVSQDFDLSLKREVSDKFKKAVLNFFGKNYLENFLKDINH
ncbi:hypothetical protein [Flavobacterium celericrescens]|uniref:Uncharacterized protein n=1 Tax=Flavobacterium celericrescens TaxID=2709780 RepID=A0ABX0ICR0_9FLAO|nr:hypothetical protein [Flavobacterium celericrescens]NHM04879.1 hypothetical protein [Flavobacterium celericrescens]